MSALREGGHSGETTCSLHTAMNSSCMHVKRVSQSVHLSCSPCFCHVPAAREVGQRHFLASLAGLRPHLDAAELSKYENWGRQ